MTNQGASEPHAVIEPGWWITAKPPEAPPMLDDGPTAAYWGWPPLVAARRRALARLERFLAQVKARRGHLEGSIDSGEHKPADWLEAEQDRRTIYAGGLGRIGGEGGFMPGWEPVIVAESEAIMEGVTHAP